MKLRDLQETRVKRHVVYAGVRGSRSRLRRSKRSVTACLVFLFLLCHSIVRVPECIVRFLPRLRRETRRWLTDWEQLRASAKRETTYLLQTENLLVHVISLNRTAARKWSTTRSLERQGVPFEVFEAVDGFGRFDQADMAIYAGSKRKSRLSRTGALSYKELMVLYGDYHARRLSDRVRQSLHERLQFGCYMSHVTLWKQVLSTNSPFFIILEDDVLLGDGFVIKLTELLRSMPESWGFLYLNGSEKKYGPRYSESLVLARGGVGAFGYVISHKAARHMLAAAVLESNKAIDHVVDEEVLSGRVLAFHAVPPLVELVQDIRSTLAYSQRDITNTIR